jgi:isopenicillin-N epimerase
VNTTIPGLIRNFGRPARDLWTLPSPGVFLNHGSFGACPIVVQDEQERLRREYSAQPEEFFRSRVMPDNPHSSLRKVADEVGEFVGTSGGNIALVENATTGIQTILESVKLGPGDQILITDHQYRAVRLAVEARCWETGAEPVTIHIPIPANAADIVDRITKWATPKTKLAIIDHITSATALVFPIREIVTALHEKNIPVLVDGAHTIGQVPLALDALGAEWYVSNGHKWLYSPPGTAFLCARTDQIAAMRCLITSHFADLGFPRGFDYVGTRDYGNWLTIPAAIAFSQRLEPGAFKKHNAALLRSASDELMALGAEPVCDIALCANMRSFVLPQRRPIDPEDAVRFRDSLWEEERIQIASSVLFDRLLIRISAQAYVDGDDIAMLREVLGRRGWPGR